MSTDVKVYSNDPIINARMRELDRRRQEADRAYRFAKMNPNSLSDPYFADRAYTHVFNGIADAEDYLPVQVSVNSDQAAAANTEGVSGGVS